MTKGKLGLNSLKNEANNIVANEEARKFVHGANLTDNKSVETEVSSTLSNASKKSTSSKRKTQKPAKKQPKLVVEGQLRNRGKTCQKPIQLYVRNELAEWIEENAMAGRGGNQILINYLIKRGIEAIEEEYDEDGMIFANENESEI